MVYTNMEAAKVVDDILAHLVDQQGSDLFRIDPLRKQFMSSEVDNNGAKDLIASFYMMDSEAFDWFDRQGSIKANAHTPRFLKKGGFVKLMEEEEREMALKAEREELEVDLARDNLKSNKFQRRSGRVNLALGIFNFIFLIINLLLALEVI